MSPHIPTPRTDKVEATVTNSAMGPTPTQAHNERAYRWMRDHARDMERLAHVLRIERARADAHRDALVAILSGIHRLLLPGEFEGHDGKVYRFEPPEIEGQLWADAYRALGDRIRAIPEELDKAANPQNIAGGSEP